MRGHRKGSGVKAMASDARINSSMSYYSAACLLLRQACVALDALSACCAR